MKVGYIGSGPISNFHLAAIDKNNMHISAIGSRKSSENCRKFANKLQLSKYFCEGGWQEVLSKDLDAFIICIHPSGTFEVVMKALDTGKPIFIEKPISFELDQIIRIQNHKNSKKIFVGYNRRYYKTTQEMRTFCEASDGGTIIANIPESQFGLINFLKNGCHIINTLQYLIGDFILLEKNIKLTKDKSDIDYISALHRNDKWSILLNVHSLIPANFYITVNSGKNVCELRPIEQFSCYEGMQRIEPSAEEPIRKYIPNLKYSFVEQGNLKPGFDFMYKNFNLFVQNQDCLHCSIDEAVSTLEFCWELIDSETAKNYSFIKT